MGKTEALVSGKTVQCFRPKELFNINTHALFHREKIKDPFDSEDDSNDDEEEITRLLRGNKDEEIALQTISKEERELISNAKIDVKAYDPENNIEHNIKVLRNMISQAKKATNTERSASMATGRREQIKM